IALINIYFAVAVRVTSNDECLWIPKKVSKDSTAIYFDVVKVEGVTWNAGIRNGDQLLEIDGKILYGTFHAQQILNRFSSGDYAKYKVMREGNILNTKVYVKKLIHFDNLASSLSALFWILIGFIVLSAKPDGRIHKLFYFIGVLTVLAAMHTLLDFFKFFDDFGFLSIMIGCLSLIGITFLPFIINYFFWNFPTRFKFAEKKWVKKIIIILPASMSVLAILSAVLAFNGIIGEMTFIRELESFGYFALFANVTAGVALIIQYRRVKSKEKRKPVLLMLIAVTFGLAVGLYAAQIAPAIADTFFNSPEYYTPIILIAIVPLIFAYAIFKYQLMDVSIVVKNTIIYGTATVSVAAIYFFVIYVAGQSISSFLGVENQGIVAGVFFIIFALVFQSTKNKFQDFLTKRFYPEQFAHQQVLVNLSNELATVVGQENILELMKKSFVDALKIDTFGILLRSNNEELKLVEGVGISNKECVITESRIPEFLKEKFLITKYPSIEQSDFNSVFLDEKAERLLEEGIHTIIPMIVKSKPVGLLLFGLKHSGSRFAGKDLELLWAAANQAAVSIENSRLYETEIEKKKIERDLDLARKIQQGLLPACIPEIGNLDICGEMIPAMQVGGDYFDLLPVDGSASKLFVVVGDVSGKGLSASLYMTKLQTMVKLYCTGGKTPKEILVDVNKRMYDEIERNWFITMTLALFDLDEGTVKFCRAGHMPILTANNGTVESYRTQGIGVGLEKGEIFERSLVEEKLKLNPGQIYAFFTDGVTEAMNESNELFGEDKLTKILKNKSTHRSTEIMKEILHSLSSFRGTAEVNDDITMVIVKVR
ncbi:MAG: SpoIIE family protein phosphatase, partial [Ignavibacteria bacterium]|nr:SpoIIE family protein phosphatase [Ignavibacteria bacterium]